MDDTRSYGPIPTPTQAIALWIAGALLTLASFGLFLRLIESSKLADLTTGELLFGIFHASFLHNVVHLLLGVGVLISAGSPRRCRTFLVTTGTALVMLVIYGQVDSTPVIPDLVPVGTADTWLHLLLALAMIVAAVLRSRTDRSG
jgi:hypothetical protein